MTGQILLITGLLVFGAIGFGIGMYGIGMYNGMMYDESHNNGMHEGNGTYDNNMNYNENPDYNDSYGYMHYGNHHHCWNVTDDNETSGMAVTSGVTGIQNRGPSVSRRVSTALSDMRES